MTHCTLPPPPDRRAFLTQTSVAALATHWLTAQAADAVPASPLAARSPHHAAKAKAVICLVMVGGPLSTQWDAHDDLNANHAKMCGHSDQPIAALLTDLKARGLLASTLVVWAGEFGRTPFSQGGRGRDHNPFGFTTWLAGGGVRGGVSYGATDDFGLRAVEKRVSINDWHATLLHLVGLDHEGLTFPHSGRDERLTDVSGTVIEDVVA
jgi:uncharacterized protein (DUF1501 family)